MFKFISKNNFTSTVYIMLKKKLLIMSLIGLCFFISCKKEAGPGGKASITGKVYVKNYDLSYTILLSEYYEQGENVYISYGNETTVGDNVKTSYDGSFVFPYLRQGKYKIWSVSKDSSSSDPAATRAIIQEIEIKDRKEQITLSDIIILK